MTRKESDRNFEVDSAGFKGHVGKMEPFRVIQEIISNSFDEDSVKSVTCNIRFNQESRQVEVRIIDDGIGFRDIEEIFTLYKRSYKRTNPKKRGRFNLGDKQFFAVAVKGHVKTKNQIVEFTETKRIQDECDWPSGVEVFGCFNWPAKTIDEAIKSLNKIIIPEDKALTINEKPIPSKKLVKLLNGVLRTEIENDAGVMEEFNQKTVIELYEKESDQKAMIYELGVPVQEFEDNVDWHVNILQKIPLRTERDVVSEAYLKNLYGIIINEATELITEENAGSQFVQLGMVHAQPKTAKHVFEKALGTSDVYIESTIDGRANDCVKEIGGRTLPMGMFDRDTRNHLIDLQVLKNATEEFGRKGIEKLKPLELTQGMHNTIRLTVEIAKDVLRQEIQCVVIDSNNPVSADYSPLMGLRWNEGTLGKKFFDKISPEMVRIIIHELSHDKKKEECVLTSHYGQDFVSELQRIGGIIGFRGISYYAEKARLPDEFWN